MLTPLAQAIVLVGIVSAVPLSAMAVLARRKTPATWYARLVPVAAGALFSGAILHLLPEANERLGHPLIALTLVAFGFLLFWRLDRLLHAPPTPVLAVDGGAAQSGGALPRGVVGTAMVGDAIHNVVDGMLIAAALLDGVTMGLVAALAISLHEMPRELGTFGILIRGGISTRKALLFNVMTGALAVAGAAAVHLAGARVADSAAWLLPVAAGNFLYLAGSLTRSEFRDAAIKGDGKLRLVLLVFGAAVTAVGALWHP